MQNIFRSLPAVLKDLDGDGKAATEAIVFAAWRKIAGSSLGEHAVPIRLFKKRLTVAVASETWRKHIEDLSGQMIFKLNSTLGSSLVTFIEFRVDAKSVDKERTKTASGDMTDTELKKMAAKEMSPSLRTAAEAITDEKLRDNFLMAAGSSLGRQKKNRKIK